MAVVWPPPRRTGAFITFAMVKFASPLLEHLQDLQATEHQGVGLACGSPGEADVVLRHGRLLLPLHWDIHLTSHRNMRTSVPTDSESGCGVHSRCPCSTGPRRTRLRAFATLDLGKLHSSVKLVFLIPRSQPLR
ncbi:hypothetical protein AOLI_G00060050 [Acnodon oligacanthus]